MAGSPQKPANRMVGALVFAFVGLFAVMVAWPYLPFGQTPANAQTPASEIPADAPIATLTLESGDVTIALRPDLAPEHVARITELANSGFYDGLVFHRVITGFMAQTGDPLGNGTGGSDMPDLAAEFSNENFVRGTLGMARSMDPNSANSQFFIVTADSAHLNGQYTLFGNVIEGMDLIDGLEQGNPAANGTVANPSTMVSLRVAAPQ
ncbi:peptidylprolyl isomerase [Pelagibacterium luteolum]|uniref:Peptidyl-prolyl cis-trans isomerase n=1 Tax=Pelagibacterium luteolum TaxID=440168 RepID=A0A1G7VXV6_9HYPH|nr:peptidylprolyl isomerase [Pelagibacterium luteolum]SDG64592.1 peptidylprolyl isomerase [Pelagibacterium luteolum]